MKIEKKYGTTVIDHSIRLKLLLTVEQYVFLDCVYSLKKVIPTISDFDKVGLTHDDLKRIYNSLKKSGLIKIEGTKMSTTKLWNEHFIDEDLLPEIIIHMNNTLGTKYSATNGDTKKHIRSRLKEGYTLHDFILVVDSRNAEWGEDPHMRQYLRPSTLFGSKFESYLQYAIANATKPITSKTNGRDKQKSSTNFEHLAGAYSDIPD